MVEFLPILLTAPFPHQKLQRTKMNPRPIEPRDLPELFDLRASTRENAISREALKVLGITEESTAKLLQTTHQGWVCEMDGKIAGFAIGDGKTGELWVIAVSPEQEGKGIGSALLRVTEDWLWSLGHSELWLWTSSDPDKRAMMFYLRHGWNTAEIKGDTLCMKKRKSSEPPIPSSSTIRQANHT